MPQGCNSMCAICQICDVLEGFTSLVPSLDSAEPTLPSPMIVQGCTGHTTDQSTLSGVTKSLQASEGQTLLWLERTRLPLDRH